MWFLYSFVGIRKSRLYLDFESFGLVMLRFIYLPVDFHEMLKGSRRIAVNSVMCISFDVIFYTSQFVRNTIIEHFYAHSAYIWIQIIINNNNKSNNNFYHNFFEQSDISADDALLRDVSPHLLC